MGSARPHKIARIAYSIILRPTSGLAGNIQLILIAAMAVSAAILGFDLRPQSHPIPTYTPTHPSLDVLSNMPNVDVTVSQAYLAAQALTVNMRVSTPQSARAVKLYVELSGVKAESFSRPTIYAAAQLEPCARL
jgi:hypothetical protein